MANSRERGKVLVVLAAAAAVVGLVLWGGKGTPRPAAPDGGPAEASAAPSTDSGDAIVVAADAGDAVATTSGAPDAGDPRCSPHVTASRAVVDAALHGAGGECDLDVGAFSDAMSACEHGENGSVWTLVAERAVVEPPSGVCQALHVDLALVHVDGSGKVTRGTPAPLDAAGGDAGKATSNLVVARGAGSRTLDVATAFDYDGDGELEVVLVGDMEPEGGPPFRRAQVWTYRDGRVHPYRFAANLDVTEAKDGDGDGRPDLMTRGPYASVQEELCGGTLRPVFPAMFLARSQTDGTFSLAGPASKKDLQAGCPAKPDLAAWSSDDAVGMAVEIACARAWGLTAAEIDRRVTSVCTKWSTAKQVCDGNATGCPVWLRGVSRIAPPVTLP